jgi:RNA polymerase-binding transcription factor DksA
MKTPATRKQPSAPEPSNARVGRAAKAAEILQRQPAATPASERVPAKWRWHHRVLLSLLSRLSRERGELRRVAAEPLEPHSLDEADSATDEFDHDLALTQLSADQDALYEVGEALQRIASRRYGRCEETGQVIPAARLRAVPWTRFTREVEERLEKQGVVQRARLGRAATVRGKGRIWLGPEEEAEEVEEAPPSPPKDEALASVFSPPGRHAARRRNSKLPPRAAKPKGRNP